MNRVRAASLVVLLAFVFAAAVAATPISAQAGLTLAATPAFDGNYMPGTWLPVEVRLSNAGPPIAGRVAAKLPNVAFRQIQPIDLDTGAEKQITLYVAMEQPVDRIQLTVERDGVVLAEQALAVRPRANERMLGILSGQSLQLALPRRQDLSAWPFNPFTLSVEKFPSRVAGLSSLGLLLISDVPTEQLSQAQRDALLGWVSAGGHLFIGGGPSALRTLAGLPPQLQPATLGAALQVADAPLAALVGAPGPGPLPGVQLTPTDGAESVALLKADAPLAWVTHSVGSGSVTQLAFDPGLPALAGWAAAPQFWDRLLTPALLISTPFGMQPSLDGLQESILAGALTTLPPVNLPPVDLIFGILALYTVLAGPGLALLLRRFDRQAWAWLAVPALVLGVGALTFGLAVALRSDQRLISQISLVEMLGPGQARARTFIGAMTPQTQRLVADIAPEALVRPVRETNGQYGAVSGASGDLAQASPSIDLNVQAWKLQGLVAEQQVALEPISAQITNGAAGLQVEVFNQSALPLHAVAAAYGERVVHLGEVAPGQRVSAPWPGALTSEVPHNAAISYLVLQAELEAGRRPGQAPDRRVLAREALINAAITRGSGTDEGPLVFAWLERSPLSFALREVGPALQQTSLLVLRPSFSGSGQITLPNGWLRPQLTAEGRSPCFGRSNAGAGIATTITPLTVTMQLPPGMGQLRAEELTLTLDSSGPWPNAGVTTSLYDWTKPGWVEQAFDGPGNLHVAAPAAYLRDGRLLLGLDGPLSQAACLYASASLRGVLP